MKKVQKIGESDVAVGGATTAPRSVVTANPPDADALATAKAKVESCRAELKQAIGELKALKTEADDDMSAQC